MDRSALNSASINGGSNLTWVYASVAISVSAAISAVAVRQYDIYASHTASASIVADATKIQQASAEIVGVGNFYPSPTMDIAAQAAITGSGNVQAYVLGYMNASAEIEGTASVTVIPASILAYANVTVNPTIVATATKIQPATSTLTGSANTTINGSSVVVTRYVNANLVLSGNVRTEARFNGVHDTYAAPEGTASIVADPIAWTMQGAEVLCSASVVPTGTLEQATYSAAYANAAVLMAEPSISQPAVAYMYPSVAVEATGEVIVPGYVNMVSTVNIQMLNVFHSQNGYSNAVATVDVSATGEITQFATSSGVAYVDCIAEASKEAVAYAIMNASIDTAATLMSYQYGVAEITSPSAIIDIVPELTQFGEVSINAETSISADAERVVLPLADIVVYGDIATDPTVTQYGESTIQSDILNIYATITYEHMSEALITNTLDIEVSAIANPASFDPESRTFYVAARQTEFARPFIETEFRRAA